MSSVKFETEAGNFGITYDIKQVLDDSFPLTEITDAMLAGRVILKSADNSPYNKKRLFTNQRGVREKSLLEAWDGKGHPENPICMLHRKIMPNGDLRNRIVVLNGNHRTGIGIIAKSGFALDLVAILDDANQTFVSGLGYDFESTEGLNRLGLSQHPLELNTYGFNGIVQGLRRLITELGD